MTTGDHARTAALLWGGGPARTRGPAQGLTLPGIVTATIALVDEIGLDALSMRHLAARLGVGVASLYTYVPGKTELLALVLDGCVGEQTLPHTRPGTWRERTEAWAREDWADYRARPWLLRLASGPIVVGPHLTAWYDSALRVVDDLGLSPHEMVATVDAVDAFVRGQARSAAGEMVEPPRVEPPVAVRDATDPFPTLTRLDAAGAFGDPEATFEFGLQRLLDGVAALIDERGAS